MFYHYFFQVHSWIKWDSQFSESASVQLKHEVMWLSESFYSWKVTGMWNLRDVWNAHCMVECRKGKYIEERAHSPCQKFRCSFMVSGWGFLFHLHTPPCTEKENYGRIISVGLPILITFCSCTIEIFPSSMVMLASIEKISLFGISFTYNKVHWL